MVLSRTLYLSAAVCLAIAAVYIALLSPSPDLSDLPYDPIMEEAVQELAKRFPRDINNSYVAIYLTPPVFVDLKEKRSQLGWTLDDMIRSGEENADSTVGAYAGDASSYEVFWPLFRPIVAESHQLLYLLSENELRERTNRLNSGIQGKQVRGRGSAPHLPSNREYIATFEQLQQREEPLHQAVSTEELLALSQRKNETILTPLHQSPLILSSRIRFARNLADVPLPPLMREAEYKQVEDLLTKSMEEIGSLFPDMKGDWVRLGNLTEKEARQLKRAHVIFGKGDRFMESAGFNADWPIGRAVWHNEDWSLLIWVNEEDHLRLISIEQEFKKKEPEEEDSDSDEEVEVLESVKRKNSSVDLKQLALQSEDNMVPYTTRKERIDFEWHLLRLTRLVCTLERHMTFAYDKKLGVITSCPSNLGTGMRSGVHVNLRYLSTQEPEIFKSILKHWDLQARGVHGEHTESKGGVYDISNQSRLGKSMFTYLNELIEGLNHLTEEEQRLRDEQVQKQ